MILNSRLPQSQFGDHKAARSAERPHRHAFATGKVLEAASPYGFHVHENVFGVSENVHEPKAFLFVEPLYPCRLQWTRIDFFPKEFGRSCIFCKTGHSHLYFRFVDIQNPGGLQTTRSVRRSEANFRTFRERNFTKRPHTRCMNHHIRTAGVWHNKAITLDRVVPLYPSGNDDFVTLSVLQNQTPVQTRSDQR